MIAPVVRMVSKTVALRTPMSLAEFLEWEDRQPRRYEFDGLRAIAMTGRFWINLQAAYDLGTAAERAGQAIEKLPTRSDTSTRPL